MTLRLCTLGWTLTCILCFKLFHGAWGDCGPPPVIQNTNPVQETSGTPGQTVVYTCDRNTGYYEIPNKSTTITCQDDNTWTTIDEFCIRACGVPERLPYAEPENINQNIFVPGTRLSYVCRPGYVRVPGLQTSITCLENYEWSIPDVFCQRRSCGHPGEVENGEMEVTDLSFGSRVTYTCNEGYRLSNRRNFRDCLADGTWSNVVPECLAVICAAPNKIDNGEYNPQKDEYSYLDSVTYICQKPFEVSGASSISCTATGEWSSSSTTCKAVNCQDPVVENSRRLSGFSGPYTLNFAISFECKENFVLRGSSSISCNIDSQWVPAVPKCEEATCGNPGDIPNGRMHAQNFNFGSKATYTCNERYAIFPASSVNNRICLENGTWSGSPPVCAAICEKPPTPHFALLDERLPIYFNGTVVQYKCNRGFNSNTDKDSTVTCKDHRWSPPDEFCTRKSCGDPGKVDNGQVEAPDHLFGSIAQYTCNEGYEVNTTLSYRECQENGKWSMPIVCKEKPSGLSVGAIVGIIIGVIAAVVSVILLCMYLSKKQKRGKLQPDAASVQYSHCNA